MISRPCAPLACVMAVGALVAAACRPVIRSENPPGSDGCGDPQACFAALHDANDQSGPEAAARALAAADRQCQQAPSAYNCRMALELRISDRVLNPYLYSEPRMAWLRASSATRVEDRWLPLDAPGAVALAERVCKPLEHTSWDVCELAALAKSWGVGGAQDSAAALRLQPQSRPRDRFPIVIDPVLVEEIELRLYAEADALVQAR